MTLNASAIIFMAVSPKLIAETIGRTALGALKTRNTRLGSNADNSGSLYRRLGSHRMALIRHFLPISGGLPLRHGPQEALRPGARSTC